MQGLLGERFLRMFTGDLKNRREHLTEFLKDQQTETEVDVAPKPEAVGPDSHAAEDCHELGISDDKDAVNGVESNKKIEIKPKKGH